MCLLCYHCKFNICYLQKLSFMIRMASIKPIVIVTRNCSNEVFSLVSGVAMVTKMGPTYPCIFMGHHDYLMLQQYNKPVLEIYKG